MDYVGFRDTFIAIITNPYAIGFCAGVCTVYVFQVLKDLYEEKNLLRVRNAEFQVEKVEGEHVTIYITDASGGVPVARLKVPSKQLWLPSRDDAE